MAGTREVADYEKGDIFEGGNRKCEHNKAAIWHVSSTCEEETTGGKRSHFDDRESLPRVCVKKLF